MHVLLARLASSVNRNRKRVLAIWLAVIVGGAWFSLHQQDHLQGGGWEVPGSQAKRANELIRTFNGYSVAGLAVVVHAPKTATATATVNGDRYRALACCAPPGSLIAAFGEAPSVVAARIARDARSDAALARDVAAAQPHGDSQSQFAAGKALSNLCADVIQLTKRSEVTAAAASVPAGWRRLVLSTETTPPLTEASCRVWNVPSAPASQRAPVRSDIPTIVFADEWDHVIHPLEGKQIAGDLGNAHLYQFPGLDHLALLNFLARDVSCPRQIAIAFLDRPTSFPSGACIASMPEVAVGPGG
jgi:hypothetical protein